jgi:hypothetical protein
VTYVSASFERPPEYPLLKFFHELHLLYKNHAWLFLKIATPPIVFGALAILATSRQANAMLATVGLELRFHLREVAFASAIRVCGFLVSWIVNVFGFAAVSVALERLPEGGSPSAEECYALAREHAGRVVALALVLFGLTVLAFIPAGFVGFLSARIFYLFVNPVSYLVLIAGLTVVSTYALAIPATLFEGLPVGAALKRSDFLTASSFGLLFVLVCEATISGYLAARIPYWIAGVVAEKVGWTNWADWILWAVVTYGVAMADLVLLIGLSFLHRELSTASSAAEVGS